MFGIDDMQVICFQYCIVMYLLVGFNFFNLFCGWIFQCGNFCLLVIIEYNICIMIRYIGCDSYCSWIICLSNNCCFVGVEFGVQDVVFNIGFGQFV